MEDVLTVADLNNHQAGAFEEDGEQGRPNACVKEGNVMEGVLKSEYQAHTLTTPHGINVGQDVQPQVLTRY